MSSILKINEFRNNSLLATIFSQFSWALHASSVGLILSRFTQIFDGIPTVLPVPEEAPPEIPRILLQSSDKQWILEISNSRLNYRWVQMAETHQQSLASFVGQFCRFWSDFRAIQTLKVGRVALVSSRYYLIDRPAFVLANHFSKDIWLQKGLGESASFEIHGHRKTKIGQDFDVNSWIRFKSAYLTIPNTLIAPLSW